MENYLERHEQSYSRARPTPRSRSRSTKKVLKQTKLPATAAVSPGSLKRFVKRKHVGDSITEAAHTQSASDEGLLDDMYQELRRPANHGTKTHFRPVSDTDSDAQADVPTMDGRAQNMVRHGMNTLISQSPARISKHRKRSKQSKIKFEPGGDRFLSSEPIDSEDEEFRGTQLAPISTTGARVTQAPVQAINVDSSESSAEELRESTNSTRHDNITIESDSEEELITPLRRRKRFMPREDLNTRGSPPQIRSRQLTEAQHEARDLDHNLIKTSKYRSANTRREKFRSHLERLRRKKAGLRSSSEEEIDDEAENVQGHSAGPSDDDTDNWIEEDEVDRAAILSDLPEIFQQPRQPIEQFKIAVQWEILDLLMPQGGLEPDSYFKPAISWLRDRTVDGAQAAISSIWRRPFVRALRRGPELSAVETGNLGFYCDACGRTNRVATYVVKFMGARYDHATLEDLDSDAESSEDDLTVDVEALSDAADEHARKERILRAEWNLGVNCYERTCVAHELFHLRKHLRQEVEEKLSSMGLFSAAKKLARSVMTKSQRIEAANQVTEQLDEARFQQRLWVQYRSTIEKNEDYIVDPNAGRKRNKYVIS